MELVGNLRECSGQILTEPYLRKTSARIFGNECEPRIGQVREERGL